MRLVCTLCFIFIAFDAIGQSLSLNQLISFVNKDVAVINEELLSKKWEFIGSENIENRKRLIWAYDFNETDQTAITWLKVSIKVGSSNRLNYQFHDRKHYSTLIQAIKALDAKIAYNEVGSDVITTSYASKNYVYYLSSQKDISQIEVFKKGEHIVSLLRDAIEAGADMAALDTFSAIYSTHVKDKLMEVPLRERPDINSKVLYNIRKTDIIEVYRRGDLYYYVYVSGKFGYVSQTFLERR